jgi:ribonuclease-3
VSDGSQSVLPAIEEPEESARLAQLETALGVQFRNRALLQLSLVHRSLLREYPEAGLTSNERLEFLGDAIIGALVAKYLYDHLPEAQEGELTLVRTNLVRASTLGEWGARLQLDRFLKLGRSDETSHRRTRLLARTFEAVVGAMYADRGVRTVRLFLRPFIQGEMYRLRGGVALDPKSRLQQITQARFELVPAYTVLEMSGPGHDPTFTVKVQVGEVYQATALGRTKQEAEQAAARLALASLDTDERASPGAGAPVERPG